MSEHEEANELDSDSDDQDYCPSEGDDRSEHDDSQAEPEEQNRERGSTVDADDAWDDFLNMVGEDKKPSDKELECNPQSAANTKNITVAEESKPNPETSQAFTEKLDLVHVEPKPDVIETEQEELKITQNATPAVRSNPADVLKMNRKRAGGGGLSDALAAISKKGKTSVLEQSRQDWDGLKTSQGIKEELDLHSKGGAGYLCKQDFLIRADHRQFELERSQRDKLRKK